MVAVVVVAAVGVVVVVLRRRKGIMMLRGTVDRCPSSWCRDGGCGGHWSAETLPPLQVLDRLVGLVVKASASRAEDPGFESLLHRDFFGVESYQ